jgi:hypothetical protein
MTLCTAKLVSLRHLSYSLRHELGYDNRLLGSRKIYKESLIRTGVLSFTYIIFIAELWVFCTRYTNLLSLIYLSRLLLR